MCANLLNHLVGVWVSDLQRAGNVPGHVDHGDDGFHLLHLVPLEPLQGQLVLISCTIPNNESLSHRYREQQGDQTKTKEG